jgi:predicted sulfurtransferase
MDDRAGTLFVLPREDVWAIRCVACNGSISGRRFLVFISRYEEYCPICLDAISRAEDEERQERRRARQEKKKRRGGLVRA